MENYSWAFRLTERGKQTLRACPECGKGLGQDDAFGHDCEVFN